MARADFPFDGILFDLDGTLLDSMTMWEGIDRKFLRTYGVTPPPDVSDLVKTMSIYDASVYFVERFSLPLTPQEVIDGIEAMAAVEYQNNLPLKAGALATLDAAAQRGLPCAIVTATYNTLVEAALTRLSIRDRFRFVLTCTDVDAPKTRPDIYHIAAERLGVTPARCIVVEDSLHCLKTAAAAGFFTVAVQDDTAVRDWDDCCATASYAAGNLSAFAAWLTDVPHGTI